MFVDDGSTDATVQVVRSRIEGLGTDVADVLCCPHAGKGSAIRAGLEVGDTDLAAFCDVDLATPLDELARIIDEAEENHCLAIGSRAAEGSAIEHHEERRREIAGKAYNLLVRMFLCPGISDTQCGAKAASTAAWRSMLRYSREDGFAWDVEIIALGAEAGGTCPGGRDPLEPRFEDPGPGSLRWTVDGDRGTEDRPAGSPRRSARSRRRSGDDRRRRRPLAPHGTPRRPVRAAQNPSGQPAGAKPSRPATQALQAGSSRHPASITAGYSGTLVRRAMLRQAACSSRKERVECLQRVRRTVLAIR